MLPWSRRLKALPVRVIVFPELVTPLWVPFKVTLAGWLCSESL